MDFVSKRQVMFLGLVQRQSNKDGKVFRICNLADPETYERLELFVPNDFDFPVLSEKTLVNVDLSINKFGIKTSMSISAITVVGKVKAVI